MAARVTVIIPTYNRAHLIGETIESVLAQMYDCFELVVVDDGSTDGTADVVRSFGDWVRYLWQPNSGHPASARNLGITASASEFVAFVDSDDTWLPPKLAHQLALMDEHPESDLVFSDAAFVDSDGEPFPGVSTFLAEARWNGEPSLAELIKRNFVPSPTPLVRRSALERVGTFDPSLHHEDYDLWLRITARGQMSCVPKVLARVRRGAERKSNDLLATLAGDVAVIEKFRREFPDIFASLGRVGGVRLSSAYTSLGIARHDHGQRRGALNAYRRALMHDPMNARALVRLALLALPGNRVVALSRLRQRVISPRGGLA